MTIRRSLAAACLAATGAFAACAQAAESKVPFPTEPGDIALHCLAASGGASAVGRHFTANPRATPLAEPGARLAEDVLVSGAVPKDYLASLETDRDRLRNDAVAFLESVGIPSQTRNPTNEALEEVASHLAQCRAWLTRRPPQLAPLPADAGAMVDHCVVVVVSAQSLGALGGNRSSKAGVQATRAASNARDVLAEMQRTGIAKLEAMRSRLQAPAGDLYLQGTDLVMGLKLARPGPLEGIDLRSLRMLNERIEKCHQALGLQMPLQ